MGSYLKVTIIALLFCSQAIVSQEVFSINTYYPIQDQNEWRYIAPDGWKDGDYISRIEEVPDGFSSLFDTITGEDGETLFVIEDDVKTFRHYDATKASKLISVTESGIYYHGETFSSDGSIAVFESPILWFENMGVIGDTLVIKRNYIRYYKNGTRQKGVFKLMQKIAGKETISVPAGNFKDCIRIEFDTYWDLGKGMEAKAINVYHHAKNIGVVKASARFIILKEGIEIINRLVEPDLKSYRVHQ